MVASYFRQSDVKIARVALPTPLHQVFDYYWPFSQPIEPGIRVTVPFGRRSLVGVVVDSCDTPSVTPERMRKVSRVHDQQPLLPPALVKLLLWASSYYHHPIGEVLASALPVNLRKGSDAVPQQLTAYRATGLADELALDSLTRAPLQHRILQRILEIHRTDPNGGMLPDALKLMGSSWRQAINQLTKKGWVESFDTELVSASTPTDTVPMLLPEQQVAVDSIRGSFGEFGCFLLNGITGSGKTEVYLRLITEQVAKGHQVLVLVPEISLTPQLLQRFQRRIQGVLVSLHSALNDTERAHYWLQAANGTADVVIGTRSAVFTPMPRLGLIVIDEEHDGSLKQQEGFRYHARDLSLMRARDCSCPVVLGSATPSMESLNNCAKGRYDQLILSQRAGDAQSPEIGLLDIRRRPLTEGMSDTLISAIGEQLDSGGQVLIFLNRRGFAPTLLCNDCGATADCKRCDAHMTVHATRGVLRCHHCGAERPVPQGCESCGSVRLDTRGYGTERIEQALQKRFPETVIARIDRDTTRRRGALEKQLADATSGISQLLVGTQMLAKGHHFPNVSLVGILDVDRGLYGTDYRALEQMGQLLVQVAGRAGRAQRRGKVLVQTRSPDNPLLQTLIREGYGPFAAEVLKDREAAALPPYTFVALIRAEASSAAAPRQFLQAIVASVNDRPVAGLSCFGPVPAPIERVSGRYRAQLLVQANSRSSLNRMLSELTQRLDQSKESRQTRWSIDVDPVDFF